MARKDLEAAPQANENLRQAAWFASFFFLIFGICLRLFAVGEVTFEGANLLVEMMIVVSATFWAMHYALSGKIVKLASPLAIVIAVLYGLAAIAAFRAPYLMRSLPMLIDWISYLLVFFLIIQFSADRRSPLVFVYALIACAAVVSAYGIFQYHHVLDKIAFQLAQKPEETLRGMDQSLSSLPDLLSRVSDKRAYGPFAIPNAFAGFLLMTIPLTVGVLIDLFKRRTEATIWAATSALGAVLLQVYAFLLTFSKGGAAVFLLIIPIFALLAFRRFVATHKKLAAAGIAAVLAVLVIAGTLAATMQEDEADSFVANKLLGARRSMQVRVNYWKAGLNMIGDHPLLGVGLENFAVFYPQYKLPEGREVQRAHNNYIQIAAEMGIPGLVIFALFWILILRYAAAHRQNTLQPTPAGRLARLAVAAAISAFFVGILLLGAFEPLLDAFGSMIFWAIIVWIWVGGFMSLAGRPVESDASDTHFARAGIVTGLVGFLLHSLVDYDLYAVGCGQTAWMLAALGLVLSAGAPQPQEETCPIRKWSLTGAILLLAAVMIVPKYGLVTRVYEAESSLEMAKKAKNSEQATFDNLSEAIAHCRKATEANPLDDKAYYLLGQCYELSWLKSSRKVSEYFHRAVKHFREAADLNPGNSAALHHIAMMYRDAGLLESYLLLQNIPGNTDLNTLQLARQRLSDGTLVQQLTPQLQNGETVKISSIKSVTVDQHMLPYVWAAAETVQSYPTNALYRAEFGEALYLAGMKKAAALQYRKALALDNKADIDRLQLPEKTRKVARQRAQFGSQQL